MIARLSNQRGITLVELLAAVFIVALIMAPILMFTLNMLDNTMNTGDRNQAINIARGILDDAREKVRAGADNYDDAFAGILSEYDITVEVMPYQYEGQYIDDLKEILVTVSKKKSRLGEVNIRTVVWQNGN